MSRSAAGRGEHGGLMVLVGVVAAIVAVQLVLGALIVTAQSWASGLQDADTLLPGTVVAGADVGGMHVDEARAAVEEAMAERLRQPITVNAGQQVWQVTPHELGARPRSEEAVASALAEASSAGPLDLARVRWLDGELAVDAPLTVDEEQAAAVVSELSADLDQPVREASLAWSGGQVELVEHRHGQALYQAQLTRDLVTAVKEGEREVNAEVLHREASVLTEDVRPLVEPAQRLAERALSHEVRVTADGAQWRLTPRDVGAEPQLDKVVAAKLNEGRDLAAQTPGARPTAPLAIPEEELRAEVERFAAEVDVPARDAQLDWSSGWLEFTEHRAGQAVDREAAVQALEQALRGAEPSVELAVRPVQPATTLDDYDNVLFLRQGERRLYHYVDGNKVADWPVTVGAGGSPTPTGVFHVGEKRHRPTWYNPDPDGWGSDMPKVIEPGRTNPLGLRALNWHKNGRDTLIRFHGTAAESTIGTAGSQGCVRLTNDDVLELFGRVPSGTTIVSARVG